MGKVIKILFSVISTLILCMIILPLLMALLLAVPSIQNFAVQRLTDVANRKLGIEVSLDKISVKGYNMLTIDDLYLEDMKGDTMLYVPKLKANLNKAGIFKGDLMFGGVKLDSAKIYLNRPLGERPNVSQFIKHLKESLGEKEKKDKKGGVLLTDLELNNSHFKYFDERFEKQFDSVLCDVPCSRYGTVTENPDIKLFRTKESFDELNKTQLAILSTVCRYVKKGGALYYSTCSLFERENDGIVEKFLSEHPEFTVEKLDSPLEHDCKKYGLQFLPDRAYGAGFYVACLRKN